MAMDEPGPRGVLAWFTRNAVAANVLMMAILAGGYLTMRDMRQEVFPSLTLDVVTISVAYPGASPKEIEDSIVLPVEGAVQGLDAIATISSVAREGGGSVSLDLIDGVDPNTALQDVRNAVDTIRTFPADAEEPRESLASRRRQVMRYALYGALDDISAYELAQSVRNDLLQLPEVSQVTISGVREPELRVEIDEATLRAYGLTHGDVAAIVRRYASDIPAGSLRTADTEVLLRTTGRRDFASELADIPIYGSITEGTVRLGDIARLRDSFDDEPAAYRVNGQPGFTISVFQVGDQKPLEVAAAVKTYFAGLAASLPPSVAIAKLDDASEQFESRISLLLTNGILGFALVLLLLTLTLAPRLAFWVALGIPVAMIGAFNAMSVTGASINMISLFAFVLVIGIVVDDAIIIGEAIYQRIERGMNTLDAAISGVRAMLVPVLLAVSTNMIAFLPFLLIPGVFGRLARDLPIVAISAFLFSLIEALFILPAHIAHHSTSTKPRSAAGAFLLAPLTLLERVSARTTHGFNWFRDRVFARVLDASIRRGGITVALFIGAVVVIIAWTVSGRLPIRFAPAIESSSVTANLVMEVDTPFARTLEAADAIEAAGMAAIGGLDAKTALRARTIDIAAGSTTRATIRFSFLEADKRDFALSEFTRAWRRAVRPQAGVRALSFGFLRGPGAAAGLSVRLAHADRATLERAAVDTAAALATFNGVNDIEDGLEPGKPQLDFSLTPEAVSAGLTLNALGRQVRDRFEGAEVQRQLRVRDEIKIIVRPPESERDSLADLDSMIIRTPSGQEMTLPDAARIARGFAYSRIRREDGRQVITVTANVDSEAVDADTILAALGDEVMPGLVAQYPGLSWEFAGRAHDRREVLARLQTGSLAALALIFALLAVAFRSYVQSLVVLLTIPFSIGAALLGHIVMGYAVSFSSFLGLVALSGLVINGAQVLLIRANQSVAEGAARVDAIREAAIRRFRPIALTSLTTTVGLMPLMFETSRQAQFLVPMAISLSFGVIVSAFTVLLFIPALYALVLARRAPAGEAAGAPADAEA